MKVWTSADDLRKLEEGIPRVARVDECVYWGFPPTHPWPVEGVAWNETLEWLGRGVHTVPPAAIHR